MSFTTPAHTITRWSVVGMEGMFAKMFDPPTESNPVTPDEIAPTNPVPEVMAQFGFQRAPDTPHTMVIELMHNLKIPTWDNRPNDMMFFLFKNPDLNDANLNDAFPSATVRMPRGVIFHCITDGKGPPPHTIHWHGMEPTTMNDGVGHCSMEIGRYNYQWQPNFIGSYFAHCHRNTVQHFEFGLYFLLLVEPPDAYFATLANPAIPIGHGRDGKRRTAANLAGFPQFPGWNSNHISAPDPWVPDPQLPWTADPRIQFSTDPHANTVPYDVEALWVLDDRDSTWSDLAPNARATFPQQGTRPGFNDNFHNNADTPAAPTDFFAFNDYHADYWYVTGVPVPTHDLTPTSIPAGIVIPPGLNSGVSGSQISINAFVGQTILIRCLNAAYNSIRVSLPVDVVVIAWDGRALGVEPYGHNNAYLVRATAPVNSYATVEFINNRGENIPGNEQVVCIARIPIVLTVAPAATGVTLTASPSNNQTLGNSITFTAAAQGGGGLYEYRFWVNSGSGFAIVQNYSEMSTFTWTPTATGTYDIMVDVRSIGSTVVRDAFTKMFQYKILPAPVTGVTLTSDLATPQIPGTPITFTATGQGGSGPYEYRFWVNSGSGFAIAQNYSPANTFVWTPTLAGAYDILVDVRNTGSTAVREASTKVLFYKIASAAATGVTLTPNLASPRSVGTPITFTAAGEGGSGAYEYRFWLNSGSGFTIVQGYSATNTFVWTPTAQGAYDIMVDVRNTGSTAFREAFKKECFSTGFYNISTHSY